MLKPLSLITLALIITGCAKSNDNTFNMANCEPVLPAFTQWEPTKITPDTKAFAALAASSMANVQLKQVISVETSPATRSYKVTLSSVEDERFVAIFRKNEQGQHQLVNVQPEDLMTQCLSAYEDDANANAEY